METRARIPRGAAGAGEERGELFYFHHSRLYAGLHSGALMGRVTFQPSHKSVTDFSGLENIYIAGGFGRYLDIENAVVIGLLPDCGRAKFRFLGDSSLAGTSMTLVSEKHHSLQKQTAKPMIYIDLNADPAYMEQYAAALFLLHTDLKLFPRNTCQCKR